MVISAIATPEGQGGVAIIRMSGEGALGIARQMFSRKGELEPNRMYAGEIDGGDFRDFGFLVWFRAPVSFTGEDVAEFHCHGGREIARGILRRTVALGARLAERGEFTRRAFLNGKLTLSAAEGMAEMISATSEAQVRAGYQLYREKFSEEGRRLQSLIRTALASAEADLDFPEEDLASDALTVSAHAMSEIEASLSKLLATHELGRKTRQGVSVVLMGRPNAGKSSLFNALLGYDRAIVSDIAGTTRDTLEGEVVYRGVLFRLIDTAGLREGCDALESEGVRRAENAVRAADLIVYLKEEGDGVTLPVGTPVITVGAKCDLGRREGCDISVSAKTGERLDALLDLIYERGYGRETEGTLIVERHFHAVERAHSAAKAALDAMGRGLPAEIYAEELRRAYTALGEITGETASENIVDEIFSRFCVGK